MTRSAQNIHFIVQLGQGLPQVVKNTTITLFIQDITSSTLLRVTAVDGCGQESDTLIQLIDSAMDTSANCYTNTAAGRLS